MANLVMYKNHCTPQEKISSGGRWYLDSDCGRKLTGHNQFTLGGSTTYALSTAVTQTAALLTSDKDFIFLKNTGTNDVFIAFNGDDRYHTILSDGESLAFELRGTDVDTNDIYLKTGSGLTSTVEYYTGT
jgi:hypothetical protein